MNRVLIEGDRVRASNGEVSPGSWSWTDLLAGGQGGSDISLGVHPELLDRAARISLIPASGRVGDDVLFVLHSLDGEGHLLQLGMVIGPSELVTTHSSFDPTVSHELLTRETDRIRSRLFGDGVVPGDPSRLAAAIAGEVLSTLEEMLLDVADRTGALDRSIREEKDVESEELLEQLFDSRHDLLTLHNRFRQNALTLSAAERLLPGRFDECLARVTRLVQVCEGERDFLQGVLDYYDQRVNLRMNHAVGRLTMIVLPVTAVAGILRIYSIASEESDGLTTALIVGVCALVAGALLLWTKKKHWW